MHSDLLGKAATLICGIKLERSHCLTVNVLFIFHTSLCSSLVCEYLHVYWIEIRLSEEISKKIITNYVQG